MMVLLDTSILVDAMRRQKPALKIIEKILNRQLQGTVSPIVIFEMYNGVHRQQHPDAARVKLDRLMSILEYRNLNQHQFRQAGLICGKLAKDGIETDAADVIIATQALTPDIDYLITENTRHFIRIPGLKDKIRTAAQWLDKN
jgi:predicted nucleic acid-binding protein